MDFVFSISIKPIILIYVYVLTIYYKLNDYVELNY